MSSTRPRAGATLAPRQRQPAPRNRALGSPIPASSDWQRRHRARRPALPTTSRRPPSGRHHPRPLDKPTAISAVRRLTAPKRQTRKRPPIRSGLLSGRRARVSRYRLGLTLRPTDACVVRSRDEAIETRPLEHPASRQPRESPSLQAGERQPGVGTARRLVVVPCEGLARMFPPGATGRWDWVPEGFGRRRAP